MYRSSLWLTISFQEPFWVGILERHCEQTLQVCRIVFVREPNDSEIWEYLLSHWRELEFTAPEPASLYQPKRINPKRQQRLISGLLRSKATSTASQQALQKQREEKAEASRRKKQQGREEREQHRLALKKQKRHQRQRGH